MLIRKIIWILNILTIIAMIFSFAAAWVSPVTLWWLALFGLAFEILFIINLIFIGYWMVVKSKRYILSLAFAMLGIGKIFGIFQINFPSKDESMLHNDGYFKVMSFN